MLTTATKAIHWASTAIVAFYLCLIAHELVKIEYGAWRNKHDDTRKSGSSRKMLPSERGSG